MQNIRNIAIIAHVDHGKTTLVDKILWECKTFSEHENTGVLILDNNELERERGITITAKNAAVKYKDYKINIIDTPGHADFGGEVERVLKMADGVLLLVDAFEGPMPQTRFVLQKALQLGLKPIVVINKVDKENCTPDEVHEKVFDLMFQLDATEEQLDFPTIYGSAKNGWMSVDYKKPTTNVVDLLDCIIEHIPAPKTAEGSAQMQVTSLDFSSFVGRIAVGRVFRGTLKTNMPVALIKRDGAITKSRIKDLMLFEGMAKIKVDEVPAGEICAVVGIEGFEIGDTIADAENPEAMAAISIDEPTMSMLFTINDSPFFGKEGKFVTSRHIKDRLNKELEKNLALRVQQGETADSFLVFGRGVLHLSVLIETMRREGYELQVGQPQVIFKEIDGHKCEPMEELTIDLPEEKAGTAIEMITQRKGDMKNMILKGNRTIMEFEIPSRGLIGLRTEMITATSGQAVMAHRFIKYDRHKGEIKGRINGSMISKETGEAIAYSLDKLQDRGRFFVESGDQVYNGMVIGENSRQDDLVVNVTIKKQLTNVRASGTDDKAKLIPVTKFSLEEALEYIQGDEYVELTPKSIRLRKIYLDENERKRKGGK
ncbi:MAG TPA: translational GTPase TypA [Chitinophagales bacterium]|jgi:GTP-binding protein|nr:translational GTPase TypA [Chitinophagales bacterium]MBP6155082.1 translational GTPase TypA [Chitinophagales bacterium]HQV76880.1 translational GTPase TypA [Chitinophagales bacterium]HQW78053.1 translational GTPase TypA [Chitinophagales bacterium]